MGTGFFVGVQNPTDSTNRWPVLVTAAHVVNGIPGEQLYIDMRKRRTVDPLTVNFRFREGQKNLYVQHPEEDVVAMFVNGIWDTVDRVWINYEDVAGNQTFREKEIHVGDNIKVFGFPKGIIMNLSLPMVRSGIIAGLLLPPATTTILIDSRILPGDSGGVVYMHEPNRTVNGKALPVSAVVGIHVGHWTDESANLGNVLSSQLVRETVDILIKNAAAAKR